MTSKEHYESRETTQFRPREQERKDGILRTEMTGLGDKDGFTKDKSWIFGTRRMAVSSLKNAIAGKNC